ncbi:MAG TPA: MerR family transcriptional regulator [Candidatus Limnocylindrales bacterium]
MPSRPATLRRGHAGGGPAKQRPAGDPPAELRPEDRPAEDRPAEDRPARTQLASQTEPGSGREGAGEPPERLLRIQEVAAETGLTSRSVRYYEELGLLRPAARSVGDYRLYDESDLERLRFIRDLRDVAGFSLAEISQLLEDEAAREWSRQAYRATDDPVERRRLLLDSIGRLDRQIGILRTKIARLEGMIGAAEARRSRLQAKFADLPAEAKA